MITKFANLKSTAGFCYGAALLVLVAVALGAEPASKPGPMALGIRAGDAQVKILTPAVQARARADYSRDLRGLYAKADMLPLYDVINLHTYPFVKSKSPEECPWTRSYPEDPSIPYLQVIDEAIAWRNAHVPGKELWITEFGYDSCTPEAMGRRQDWFLKLN
jgi:hypothetical protein